MIVIDVIWGLLGLFLLFLIFRLVMEWVFVFARDYRPRGVMAVALEITYTVTDPPYKALRRIIPPLRIGAVAVDLAFMVLFFIVAVLMSVLSNMR